MADNPNNVTQLYAKPDVRPVVSAAEQLIADLRAERDKTMDQVERLLERATVIDDHINRLGG